MSEKWLSWGKSSSNITYPRYPWDLSSLWTCWLVCKFVSVVDQEPSGLHHLQTSQIVFQVRSCNKFTSQGCISLSPQFCNSSRVVRVDMFYFEDRPAGALFIINISSLCPSSDWRTSWHQPGHCWRSDCLHGSHWSSSLPSWPHWLATIPSSSCTQGRPHASPQ